MNFSYLITVLYYFVRARALSTPLYYDIYDQFIIATEGCNITNISVRKELIKAMSGLPEIENCRQQNQLLGSNATHIWILQDMLTSFNISDESSLICCYSNFSTNNDISNILYSDCHQFRSVIKAEHEFVRVECSYKKSVIYSDYFVFSPKERPKRKVHKSTFNVIVLGLESLSRLNFERTMPKTAKFLKDRGAVQLRGYNKVGYNSFPNLFPLLTGRSYNSCLTTECSFIWELFRNSGYYTALGSDSVVGTLGSYEYGWSAIPTDFYLQPFMAETENVIPRNDINKYNRRCLGGRVYYKIVLDYTKRLLRTMRRNNKLFGYFWEESVSHDELKKPQLMDEGYLNFVTELETQKYLDDTILIVLSDHGMRWGGFANTRQGLLEASLPLFSILLPTSFRETYKDAFKHFLTNSGRLVTPYDVYHTLVDLVNPSLLKNHHLKLRMRALKSIDRHMSLFLPVPENRTCRLIGIEEPWCACDVSTAEPTEKKEVAMAAAVLLDNINGLIAKFPCQKLRLNNILDNVGFKAVTENGRTYTITLETIPGGGVFQGMIRRQHSQWVAYGPITRLNRYNDRDSSCVEDALIKLYCSCNLLDPN